MSAFEHAIFHIDLLLIRFGASVRLVAALEHMEEIMGILESLTLSTTSRHADAADKAATMRRKFITALEEQIAVAQADATGQSHVRKVQKTVKNAETGVSERRTVDRPVRRMFWRSNDGVVLEPRFAGRPLALGEGRSSILVGDDTNLVPVLETLIKAVRAFELDEAMKAASDGRKRPVRRKDGKPIGVAAATVTKPLAKVGK